MGKVRVLMKSLEDLKLPVIRELYLVVDIDDFGIPLTKFIVDEIKSSRDEIISSNSYSNYKAALRSMGVDSDVETIRSLDLDVQDNVNFFLCDGKDETLNDISEYLNVKNLKGGPYEWSCGRTETDADILYISRRSGNMSSGVFYRPGKYGVDFGNIIVELSYDDLENRWEMDRLARGFSRVA